ICQIKSHRRHLLFLITDKQKLHCTVLRISSSAWLPLLKKLVSNSGNRGLAVRAFTTAVIGQKQTAFISGKRRK
ncbi:MAG: hypothetical protein OXE85_03840, partial [Roseovarius sp.]|nr:hypothetical protein [Roseovarius sp.]